MIQKLILETLKNPKTGQWSRKNIAGSMAFAYAVYYCTYGLWEDKQIQEFVVMAFLTFSATCLGISSWEKKNIEKNESTTIN